MMPQTPAERRPLADYRRHDRHRENQRELREATIKVISR